MNNFDTQYPLPMNEGLDAFSIHNAAVQRLAVIEEALANAQRDADRQQLQAMREQQQNYIAAIERSPGYNNALFTQKMQQQRSDRQALQERAAASRQAKLAERNKYDEFIHKEIDWSLVSVPQADVRRQLARDHAEKLAQIREGNSEIDRLVTNRDAIAAVLAENSLPLTVDQLIAEFQSRKQPETFESKVTDQTTGKHYIITTDAQGTFVQSNVYGDIGIEGGE